MKKILVLSYFFPPCNLTPSQRAFSWASILNRYGYYPIIITRRWDQKINTPKDVSVATGTDIIHQKEDNYETYYVPYHPNLRDRIYTKYGENGWVKFRKMLTVMELFLQNISNKHIPCHNMYDFAALYLKDNPDVKLAVATGNPYSMFKFCYLLHKNFGIKWIADYRDAWTTCDVRHSGKESLYKLINVYDKFFEKKWVRTASFITSTSQPLVDEISSFVKVEGTPLYNGFNVVDFKNLYGIKPFEKFTISHIGTLYEGQRIEIFCEAFKRLINNYKNPRIKFYLPGIAFHTAQKEKIDKLLKGYEAYYECTDRIDRELILEIEVRSHVLLHVGWDSYEGIVASKIYEYLASGSMVLVSPTDKSVIEQIIKESKCGFYAEGVDDTFELLVGLYEDFLNNKTKVFTEPSRKEVQAFSRENQTKKLSELLDKLA